MICTLAPVNVETRSLPLSDWRHCLRSPPPMARETSPAAPACGNLPTVARADPPSTLALTDDAGSIALMPRWLWAFIVVVIVAFICPTRLYHRGNAMESIINFFRSMAATVGA
jgi:hypothetical protein